jgi:hypothetical protein
MSRYHTSRSIHADAGAFRAVSPHDVMLQRTCACGSATSSLTDECADCSEKRLQAKLDSSEQSAEDDVRV